MNSHVEPSVTQIIKSINKFDGTNFLEWKRQTRAGISLSLPSISEIINGKTRLGWFDREVPKLVQTKTKNFDETIR